MRTIARSCVVTLLASALATGCAHFRVAPEGMPPATPPQVRRVHAIGWGAMETRTAPSNCNGSGLSSVTVKVTAIDFIATVATLGFWAPVTVEWTCAKTTSVPR